MTVGEVLARNARKFPGKTAVVSDEVSLTFRALDERVNRLANALTAKGLEKGDRLGVVVHNCHQFVELWFTAAKTGAIFCPYNNHLRSAELRDLINYSTPKFLFVDEDFCDMIDGLRPELPSVEGYVGLKAAEGSSYQSYEALLAGGSPAAPGVEVAEGDVQSIYFTAGTTGKPKGAMRTHRHLLSNAAASAIDLKVDYDEQVLITFPMYHVACEDNLSRHSFLPNTFHIKREGSFNPAEVLDYISRARITRCQLVPTMIHSLIQLPDIAKYDLSALRLILYAGASMPVALLQRSLEIFPCGFAQMYGMTESGPFTTVLKPEDHILDGSETKVARLASSGRPALNYEVRIVDESDVDVAVGAVGEIVVRSEAMMIGYWQMPDASAEKLKNGWLHTGDLGRFDEDGYVYIVERKNDMIISGGVNVYPREIEEVLYRHPAVSEAAVVGVPDEHWGEVVKAVIVLQPGQAATEQEIRDFCGENLAGFKKPKSVDFWEGLPKSPQGKILKTEIRKHYQP